MSDQILFPGPGSPGYPDGISCQTFAHPFSSGAGCTDEYGNVRGYTQEWYFDASAGVWLAVSDEEDVYPSGSSGEIVFMGSDAGFSASSRLNFQSNRLSLEGSLSNKIKSHASVDASTGSPGVTQDLSFLDSDVHYVTFSGSGGVVNLNITNPPDADYYGEMTLIVNDAAAPSDLNIVGNSGASTVKMDQSSPAISDVLVSGKLYMWKAWTIDGGSTYYVYRVNGFGRYWS